MTNFYWPVFKNLEFEVEKLTYDIHINDDQLNVYSTKISDLILRAAVEIESIAKELYRQNGGQKQEIKFDDEALKLLNQKWNLNSKVAILSSTNCYLSKNCFKPFLKSEKNSKGRLTYSWNNAYQHLKHNRGVHYKYGNIKNLLEILSALFLLNVYYKNENYPLLPGNKLESFPINQGSIFFSIKIHKWFKYDEYGYGKREDFDECVYITKYTENTMKNHREIEKKVYQRKMELTFKHPKFIEFLTKNSSKKFDINNIMYDLLSSEEYTGFLRDMIKPTEKDWLHETEIVLNKNNV